jgi:hypothetical protein
MVTQSAVSQTPAAFISLPAANSVPTEVYETAAEFEAKVRAQARLLGLVVSE